MLQPLSLKEQATQVVTDKTRLGQLPSAARTHIDVIINGRDAAQKTLNDVKATYW